MVTITFFRYAMRGRWRGFTQMGKAGEQLAQIPGLLFFKMLGTGSGNGFSIWPDFSTYGLLATWDSGESARAFLGSETFRAFSAKAEEQWTVLMKCKKSHGQWQGIQPFGIADTSEETTGPIAVITRARIRPAKLIQFWSRVPRVSGKVGDAAGKIFAKGIGELPLIEQATFSLWESEAAMRAYAYKGKQHRKVIQQTRELGWYSEELFARFVPLATLGSWYGADPLAALMPIRNHN